MCMIGDLLADGGKFRLRGRQGKLEPVRGRDRRSGTTADEKHALHRLFLAPFDVVAHGGRSRSPGIHYTYEDSKQQRDHWRERGGSAAG